MAKFNQQNQNVQQQYNADRIDFRHRVDIDEMLSFLKHIHECIELQRRAGHLEKSDALSANAYLNQAIEETKSKNIDNKKLIEHLSSVKDVVTNVDKISTSASKLVDLIGSVIT